MVLAYKKGVNRNSLSSINALSINFFGLVAAALFSLLDLTLRYILPLAIPGLQDGMADGAPFTNFFQGAHEIAYVIAFTFIGTGFLLVTRTLEKYKNTLVLSGARFRALVENQSELIVVWKPGLIRTWVNDAYCEFCQQPREKLIGTNFSSSVSGTERDELEDQFNRLNPDSPFFDRTVEITRPDGSKAWYE